MSECQFRDQYEDRSSHKFHEHMTVQISVEWDNSLKCRLAQEAVELQPKRFRDRAVVNWGVRVCDVSLQREVQNLSPD